MAGKKRGSILWKHHVQALVDEKTDAAVREYARLEHNGSISTAARHALEDHLAAKGYLDIPA